MGTFLFFLLSLLFYGNCDNKSIPLGVNSLLSERYSVTSSSVRLLLAASDDGKIERSPLNHHPQSFYRQQSRRWNGNYKHTSKQLADVSKAKKLTLQLTANGITKTLEKKRMESLQHVLTKAVLWNIYIDEYPDIEIERDIGDPDYLPDVISWNETSMEPLFWGESGRMKVRKALDLMRRYPRAHIVHCRWGMDIQSFSDPLIEYVANEVSEGRLDDPSSWFEGKFSWATIDFNVWRFIDEESGTILATKDDLEWKDFDLSSLAAVHVESSSLSDKKSIP
jgi:hypothetical protein